MVDQVSCADEQSQAFYGLPAHVQYCKRCVISNQRPSSTVEFKNSKDAKKDTIHFDEEGICAACRFADYKEKKIDWHAREEELIKLCNEYRSKQGNYDCIVPGSGGKDSAFTSHILKYKYGMHPLTVTWAPELKLPPLKVPLTGQGVGPQIAGAKEVRFDSTGVTQSDTMTYTIRNDSQCELRIDRLTITGTNANEFRRLAPPNPSDNGLVCLIWRRRFPRYQNAVSNKISHPP